MNPSNSGNCILPKFTTLSVVYSRKVTVKPSCSYGLLFERIALINASLSDTVAEPGADGLFPLPLSPLFPAPL